MTFVIASATAGLMGSFQAHYFGSISPATFDLFKTIHVHIYAILGGIGFAFLGPAVGAFLLTIAPEVLRISKELEPILTGLILVIVILFAPKGIIDFYKAQKGKYKPIRWLINFKNNS